MAVKTWDQIYSSLSADEKKLIDNLKAKEPELVDGWLRQDDYSRKQAEFKAKEAEFEEAVSYKQKMEPWAQEAYDRIHSLEEAGVLDVEGKVIWTEQKKKLEQELEAAKRAAVAGGEMKPEELEAEVKRIIKDAGSALTKDEIQALYANEAKKMVEDGFKERETKFNSETIPFIAGFAGANAVVAMRYEQTSGEKWTPEKQKEFFKMMSDEGKFDPYALEEKLLEPVKAKKQMEKEIEERAEKIAREKYGYRGMPGGGEERFIPPPDAPKGALQQALENSGSGSDLETLIKTQSVAAAKELVDAGKF